MRGVNNMTYAMLYDHIGIEPIFSFPYNESILTDDFEFNIFLFHSNDNIKVNCYLAQTLFYGDIAR